MSREGNEDIIELTNLDQAGGLCLKVWVTSVDLSQIGSLLVHAISPRASWFLSNIQALEPSENPQRHLRGGLFD